MAKVLTSFQFRQTSHYPWRDWADGRIWQAKPGIDFRAAVQADTLLTQPLQSLGSNLALLGWLDDRFSLIARAERALRYRRTCP